MADKFLIAALSFIAAYSVQSRPAQSFEIKLPPGLPSESLVVRYFVAGAYGSHDGWISPRPNETSYLISTSYQDLPALSIKAILNAPGCAIETFSEPLTNERPHEYDFQCHRLPTVSLDGFIAIAAGRAHKIDFDVTVNYVAYWAHTFFGPEDGPVITTVPVAEASPDVDGRFHAELPDLARDPIAGAPGNEGTFQFQARNRLTGDLMGRLVPTACFGQKFTPMDSLSDRTTRGDAGPLSDR